MSANMKSLSIALFSAIALAPLTRATWGPVYESDNTYAEKGDAQCTSDAKVFRVFMSPVPLDPNQDDWICNQNDFSKTNHTQDDSKYYYNQTTSADIYKALPKLSINQTYIFFKYYDILDDQCSDNYVYSFNGVRYQEGVCKEFTKKIYTRMQCGEGSCFIQTFADSMCKTPIKVGSNWNRDLPTANLDGETKSFRLGECSYDSKLGFHFRAYLVVAKGNSKFAYLPRNSTNQQILTLQNVVQTPFNLSVWYKTSVYKITRQIYTDEYCQTENLQSDSIFFGQNWPDYPAQPNGTLCSLMNDNYYVKNLRIRVAPFASEANYRARRKLSIATLSKKERAKFLVIEKFGSSSCDIKNSDGLLAVRRDFYSNLLESAKCMNIEGFFMKAVYANQTLSFYYYYDRSKCDGETPIPTTYKIDLDNIRDVSQDQNPVCHKSRDKNAPFNRITVLKGDQYF